MGFQRILPTFQEGNLLITAVVDFIVAAMIHDKLLRSVQLYHHQYKRIITKTTKNKRKQTRTNRKSLKNHTLNIQITVTDSSVTLNCSFALRTEEHLHHLGVRFIVLVCLQTPPESSKQLQVDLTFFEVLARLDDELQHGVVGLIRLPPYEHLLVAP